MLNAGTLHLLGDQKDPGQDWGQRTLAQQTKAAKHLVEQLAGLEKGLALLREAKELANLSPVAKLNAAYYTFMRHAASRELTAASINQRKRSASVMRFKNQMSEAELCGGCRR